MEQKTLTLFKGEYSNLGEVRKQFLKQLEFVKKFSQNATVKKISEELEIRDIITAIQKSGGKKMFRGSYLSTSDIGIAIFQVSEDSYEVNIELKSEGLINPYIETLTQKVAELGGRIREVDNWYAPAKILFFDESSSNRQYRKLGKFMIDSFPKDAIEDLTFLFGDKVAWNTFPGYYYQGESCSTVKHSLMAAIKELEVKLVTQ